MLDLDRSLLPELPRVPTAFSGGGALLIAGDWDTLASILPMAAACRAGESFEISATSSGFDAM